VSNAGTKVLKELLGICTQPPLINQIEVHPCLVEQDLIDLCRKNGIQIQSYSPIKVPLQSPLVHALAKRMGATPMQVLLSWHFSQQFGVVTSTSKEDHLAGFDCDVVSLDVVDLAALGTLNTGIRLGMWDLCLAGMYYGTRVLEPMNEEAISNIRPNFRPMAMHSTRELPDYVQMYAPQSAGVDLASAQQVTERTWRAMNAESEAQHRADKPVLSTEHAAVLDELNSNGIVLTAGSRLHDGSTSFESILRDSLAFVEQQRAGRKLPQPRPAGEYVQWFRLQPAPAALQAALTRFALGPLLDIVNSYCEMSMRLFEIDFVHTDETLEPLSGNNTWHVDFEDYHVLKAYLYLSDVSLMTGPLRYLRGTHPKSRSSARVAEFARNGQWDTPYVFKCFNPYSIMHAFGPAGSLVVFDARGIHSGGHVLAGTRDVVAFQYLAGHAIHRERRMVFGSRIAEGFQARYPDALPTPPSSSRARHAVSGQKDAMTNELVQRLEFPIGHRASESFR
jgi:hypothetical protein